jgi:hypothetical protein
MSRQLPAHPNLEHLRKQAKELLAELRREKRDARLADAQHAVARVYGAASWPQLKARVEALRLEAARSITAASPPGEPSPFAGTWVANLAKSRPLPLNEYSAATLRFAVTGDTITLDDVVVDAAGRSEQTRNVIHADGRERWAAHGLVVTARRLGARGLEAVVKRHGAIEGRVTYEVSADGNTLILTAGEQRAVFDRLEVGT